MEGVIDEIKYKRVSKKLDKLIFEESKKNLLEHWLNLTYLYKIW